MGIAFFTVEMIALNQSFEHLICEGGIIGVASFGISRWFQSTGSRAAKATANTTTGINPFTWRWERRQLCTGFCLFLLLRLCKWKQDNLLDLFLYEIPFTCTSIKINSAGVGRSTASILIIVIISNSATNLGYLPFRLRRQHIKECIDLSGLERERRRDQGRWSSTEQEKFR